MEAPARVRQTNLPPSITALRDRLFIKLWPKLPDLFRPEKSIRFRILLLVIAILLPLLGLISLMAVKLATTERRLIEAERAALTDAVTSRVDELVAQWFGLMQGLASSDNLQKRQFANFQLEARQLLTRSDLSSVSIFSRKGELLNTTGLTAVRAGHPLSANFVERVFSGVQSATPVSGTGLRQANVMLGVPVLIGGRVAYGLAAEIPVRNLKDVFAAAGLSPNWPAAVVDRNGRFVGRSRDADERAGKPARPELRTAARAGTRQGIFENTTYEGVRALNSFQRSNLTDWTTVVAVPKETVLAPLRRNIILTSLGSALVLALTIVIASTFASRIAEPVRNLGNAARALVKGDPFVRPRFPITELNEVQKAFESAITESSHLAAIVASSGDAIISMDLQGQILTWNHAAEKLFGYKAEEVIGRQKSLLVPEDRRKEFSQNTDRVIKGESLRIETVRCRADGRRIHVSIDTAPIRRPDGKIIAISSILHDITQRIAAEDHLKFLMREVAHRSKNQLAVIKSIASLSGRNATTVRDFLQSFRFRLEALAASQELLLQQDWRGVPLEELVRKQLTVFGGDAGAIDIHGPDIVITPANAEAIGMALHELATNAAKYGALTTPEGRVTVSWKQIGEGNQDQWELSWIETGGPPVRRPDEIGFGTLVVTRMVELAGGDVRLDYAQEGVRWSAVFSSGKAVAISAAPQHEAD